MHMRTDTFYDTGRSRFGMDILNFQTVILKKIILSKKTLSHSTLKAVCWSTVELGEISAK